MTSIGEWIGRCINSVGAGVAMHLAGCSMLPMPGSNSEEPMVLLPITSAGVEDGRAAFAAQFKYELIREGTPADTEAWLHGIPGALSAAAPLPKPGPGTSVLVVPGIFGECLDGQALPFSDGVSRPTPKNYEQGYQHFREDLGTVRAIKVGGRASSHANAGIVAEAVKSEAARNGISTIILVAYSKGLPDTLHALQTMHANGELPASVKAVVSLSGVLLGTPIADQFAYYYDKLVAPLEPLGCPVSQGGEVQSLSVAVRTPWLLSARLPEHVALFSVVAHTPRNDVAPALLPFFDLLGQVDPLNDGQVYSAWSVLPRGHLLAEVRSDHWRYVLALEKSEDPTVRAIASPKTFPRDAFFRALVKSVVARVSP